MFYTVLWIFRECGGSYFLHTVYTFSVNLSSLQKHLKLPTYWWTTTLAVFYTNYAHFKRPEVQSTVSKCRLKQFFIFNSRIYNSKGTSTAKCATVCQYLLPVWYSLLLQRHQQLPAQCLCSVWETREQWRLQSWQKDGDAISPAGHVRDSDNDKEFMRTQGHQKNPLGTAGSAC